ncbi:MAG: hypothetical protein K1X78_04585 [Verrucomicrobiaceae bacterium]|nr:hypothetical protein [Verrucomicrobiaceae bacterium]
MMRFLIGFGVLFMQVAASLTCFIVLYVVGALVLMIFLDQGCPSCPTWHEVYAHMVAVTAALYFSFRMGFRFAHPARPTTWHDARFLAKVATSLIGLWLMVFAGAFDLAVYFAKAIRAPLRCPDEYVPELEGLAWIKPSISLPLSLVLIGFLGRWCVGSAHFRIR